MSLGLHHNGMHNFILDEIEFGTRVAYALDDEALGFGTLFDLQYEEYLQGEENSER